MIVKSVMFSFLFGSVTILIGEEQRRINSADTMDSVEISIIYGTLKIIDTPDHIRWPHHFPIQV